MGTRYFGRKLVLGDRDDRPHRPVQLHPVPDDAGLAGAGAARATRTSTPRSSPRPVSAGASTSRSSRTSSWRTSRRRAQGDLGYSLKFEDETVVDVLATHFWPTVILFGVGEVLAAIIGLALGAYTGWRRGGPIDLGGNAPQPDPLFDAVLRHRHAAPRGLRGRSSTGSPSSGMLKLGAQYNGPFDRPLDFLAHFTLPVTTVAHRAHRPVLDPHALVGHRDPQRGLHHDGPGQGHRRHPASCAPTPCRTRSCRR